MLTLENRFLVFPELQIWWPEDCDEVYRLLPRSPILTVMQCSEPIAGALRPYAFRDRLFYTSLVDLSSSEEDLWSRLHGQSCQYKIRKAERLGCTVSVNEDGDEALNFINRFIRRRSYRRPISWNEWRRCLAHGDVWCAKHAGQLVAAHVLLVDPPHRVRLLFSATADGGVEIPSSVVHVANRYLHWTELSRYRGQGIADYDFGGIVLDAASSLYPISQFKLSFGGRMLTSHILRLARNSRLRAALRELARVKALSQTGRRMVHDCIRRLY